ncbi:L-ascorbate metabolism protein UlaG, beta-lactamase superfamily [Poseidonocella pacifica]|uniref:L-ascorbate metabolism protein UlaG, beta-lactamase superfamily n=1 Tax=Poseidonocella pacifica TaxID=871651 RepID=A0A1I0VQU6_9RHOB|nr:MBL fold metallo-hydrolase [Poseidonocella pacifica]SFA78712.1 L-ascorbate metabolism protein UlaG, beta-lactamase superfamily [Poseidonocella pacifica]
MLNRRNFLTTTAAGVAITVLPFRAGAAGHGANMFKTDSGEMTVHPVEHASMVLETPGGVIYVDPVGGAEAYADLPKAQFVLITHQHADHFDPVTLAAVAPEGVPILTNPAVYEMLDDTLKAQATAIANGESTTLGGMSVDAIPAYNLTEDRLKYHPPGRDNGYILDVDGLTVYIAGDTEDTPEMRALSGIDVAFVPMNLPYTMEVEKAADAVAEFKPTVVYPYHYRGSDIEAFAKLVQDATSDVEVRFGDWYA